MTASISRRGYCYANAPMKSFWGMLRNELVQHRRYETREQARREISRSSITVSGGTPGSGIAPRQHLPSSGPVSSRRRETATQGIHY